jgi:1-deoxy-D-xylulose-5-phosphate reductoisomerase
VFYSDCDDMAAVENIRPLAATNTPKKVSVLGVTGSVGRSTADVIASQPEQFDVQSVTANNDVKGLAASAIRLAANKAVIANPALYSDLKTLLQGTDIDAAAGEAALLEAASMPADCVMGAISGMAGLSPLMKAIEQGTSVAIANKEPLVAAGPLVLETARKYGTKLLPVDSEHNAIFQVFDENDREGIERIILTASGGPFLTWSQEDIAKATPEQAVAHPNWSMGAKISVDSATLMNKALEVIEAHYLFAMPAEKIDVLIHPQSIIHSMVEYADGSVLAQLGAPDMRTPIAYTLAWPKRMKTPGQRLDWRDTKRLDFKIPDYNRFPLLKMAYDCLATSPAACLVFNAANEVAVAAFLGGRISFPAITDIIEKTMDKSETKDLLSLEDIISLDHSSREQAESYII